MNDAAIDRTTYDGLVESTGDEFVCELVDTFLADAPEMLGELRSALGTHDAERFRRTAHSLKSNANTFGALALAALAKDVELGGLAPVLAASGAPLDALEREYARVALALKDLARG